MAYTIYVVVIYIITQKRELWISDNCHLKWTPYFIELFCATVSLSKDILKFIMTRITYCTTLLVVSEHGSHNNKCHKKMHFSQKSKTSFTRSKLYFVRGRVQYILCLRHIFFIARIIFKFITKRIPVNNLSKNLIWPIHRKSNGSLPLVSSLLLL